MTTRKRLDSLRETVFLGKNQIYREEAIPYWSHCSEGKKKKRNKEINTEIKEKREIKDRKR